MVELHGGTGYLMAQFLSPRTSRRTDAYGGALGNRQRFALEVVAAVRQAVDDVPAGHRALTDEWMPDSLQPDESRQFARTLADACIAYVSVMDMAPLGYDCRNSQHYVIGFLNFVEYFSQT